MQSSGLQRLSGRPLLDTTLDAELFVDRAPLLRTVTEAVTDDFNVLVVASRGAGTTSFLRQVARNLRSTHQEDAVTYCDGAPFTFAAEFLAVLRERILGPRNIFAAMARSPAVGYVDTALTVRKAEWSAPGLLLREIDDLRRGLTSDQEAGSGDRRIVLLDNPDPQMVHTLFGRMRDEMWALPITWIVSGDVDKRGMLVEPPADAFFEYVVELEDLDDDAAGELLRRRVTADVLSDAALAEVVRLGGGNPRRLIAVAREAAADGPHWARRRLEKADSFEEAVAALGRSEAMLVAELRSRSEPVSASDDRLQSRLGWTRARLAQVFGSLETAGLVVASYGNTGRPGRPKKLYQLVGSFP